MGGRPLPRKKYHFAKERRGASNVSRVRRGDERMGLKSQAIGGTEIKEGGKGDDKAGNAKQKKTRIQ